MSADVKSLLAVPFSIIPPTKVEWLIPGWIARRHVTLVVAPGGTSKGLLTIDLAARVTRGDALPGEPHGSVHEPANVVLVAPEDDPNEAVAWRLAAAGADVARVFNLTVLPDGSPFKLPANVPDLRAAIDEIEETTGIPVGMVVIDPLFACLAKGHNVSTQNGARAVTEPLEHLAKDAGCAIVLTHHTVWSGKAAGSKGLIDSVRMVLRIARIDATSPARLLSIEKANNTDDTKTMRYQLAGDTDTDSHVVWAGQEGDAAASRGYTISEAAAPAKPVKAESDDAGNFTLYQMVGGATAVVLGTYELVEQAKDAAEQTAGYALAWNPGPVAGSVQAAATAPKKKFQFFTVMPLDSSQVKS